jgi:hypothetical protein
MVGYDFSDVCGPARDMPHAFATYRSFWSDRARQLSLANYLLRTAQPVAGCATGACDAGSRASLACIDDSDCPQGACVAESGGAPPLPTTTTTTLPPPGPALTWRAIQAVFAQACDGAGCHTAAFAGGGLGGLDDVGDGYANLIGAPVVCGPASSFTQLVVPGDPEASFLLAKLDGTFDCGLAMPIAAVPLQPEVIAGIGAWIAAGAPDN